MTVTSKQKTILAIVLGAVVAIAPSFFSYLQARQEIREKYRQNRAEATVGYDVLVTSIKDLQRTVTEQHDYIVKLQGQVTLITDALSPSSLRMMGSGAGSTATAALPTLEAPPELPSLPAPPPDFSTAQMAR